MTEVKNWLDENYPKEERKNISELIVRKKESRDLEKVLDLSDFENLEELTFSKNKIDSLELKKCSKLKWIEFIRGKITKLDLSNCKFIVYLDLSRNNLTNLDFLSKLNEKNLKNLSISDNSFSPSELNYFSNLINLEKLDISKNEFFGSLEYLGNLGKLKKLIIWETDIDKGLEFLPNSIQVFQCSKGKKESKGEKKVNQIIQELKEIGEPKKNDFSSLLKIWKQNKKIIDSKENNYQNQSFNHYLEERDEDKNSKLNPNNNKQKILREKFFLETKPKIFEIFSNEKLTVEEKIGLIINEIAELERGDGEKHEMAIVEPSRSNKKKYLDTLARLFTGNETCVATFFNGKDLFISSNRESPEYAKFYIKHLKKFLINPNDRNIYNKLIELSFREINFQAKKLHLKLIIWN